MIYPDDLISGYRKKDFMIVSAEFLQGFIAGQHSLISYEDTRNFRIFYNEFGLEVAYIQKLAKNRKRYIRKTLFTELVNSKALEF